MNLCKNVRGCKYKEGTTTDEGDDEDEDEDEDDGVIITEGCGGLISTTFPFVVVEFGVRVAELVERRLLLLLLLLLL